MSNSRNPQGMEKICNIVCFSFSNSGLSVMSNSLLPQKRLKASG
jgi:hypothetical protein